MKGYTKQKLTFTKVELIQQLQNWNCNITDLFDEDKIDIGIFYLTQIRNSKKYRTAYTLK